MNKALCPAIDSAITRNAGSYDPDSGLYYKVGMEFCADIDFDKLDQPPSAPLEIDVSYTSVAPPDHEGGFGHVSARDPISGETAWDVEYKYPPLASLLTTKGGLVFVAGADGWFDALASKTGQKLWSHNDRLGHHGGIISYMAGEKQYIAVVTGWSSRSNTLFGEPSASMPANNGQLVVFSLP
jgi:hypothetical protein